MLPTLHYLLNRIHLLVETVHRNYSSNDNINSWLTDWKFYGINQWIIMLFCNCWTKDTSWILSFFYGGNFTITKSNVCLKDIKALDMKMNIKVMPFIITNAWQNFVETFIYWDKISLNVFVNMRSFFLLNIFKFKLCCFCVAIGYRLTTACAILCCLKFHVVCACTWIRHRQEAYRP